MTTETTTDPTLELNRTHRAWARRTAREHRKFAEERRAFAARLLERIADRERSEMEGATT